MLSVFDGSSRTDRRGLLMSIGSLTLGGLALPTMLSQRAAAAAQVLGHITGKSVIFLFQQGGPSQLETFDPKPDAASGVRTITDTIPTALPGVRFGEALPQLAALANELTVVRSFQTGNGGHNIQPIVGPDSRETNIGVHYSRVVGATRPSTGMPTNAVLFPTAVAEDVGRAQARGNLSSTGSYGSGYAPFVPGAGGDLQRNMQLNLPAERLFDDRRALLDQLDRLNRTVDATGQLDAMDELRRQAFELLLGGGVAEALDLSREDPATLARYDTGRFARKGQWDKSGRGKRGYYYGQASTIGRLLLLARRLCERGCGFVTIHAGYQGVWDMHADGNNLNMVDGMQAVGRPFDHAVAAFVRDLKDRGMHNDILLICTGEMGRTPRINRRGGRDHWGRLAPLLMYGGGLEGGQVIGQSTRDGGQPANSPFGPANLISTILNTLFDVGQLRLIPGVPGEVLELSQARMIASTGR